MSGWVGAFREILAEQWSGVLVGSPLPGAVRITEVDRKVGLDAQFGMFDHLRDLVPSQRAAQLCRQGSDLSCDRVTDCCGAVPGQ
jgi:hypothetical protein